MAPPKFREETSKKAVRRSASARRRMAFAGAACKVFCASQQELCPPTAVMWLICNWDQSGGGGDTGWTDNSGDWDQGGGGGWDDNSGGGSDDTF